MEDLTDARVEVRLYGDLDWFCSEADRNGVVSVPMGFRRSVKDLVESLGVPHVEVGALLVDGDPADFETRVEGGARVTVYPPMGDLEPPQPLWPTPPDPLRFVADVHLGALARLLRHLGLDTVYESDADDEDLARWAVAEDRVLLSRDRQLLMRRAVTHGYCPRSMDADQQLDEVVRRYDLEGRTAPFTRCAECNGHLDSVDRAEVLDQLPPRTRVEHDTFARCRSCAQVYWPGSHVDALTRRFEGILEGPGDGETRI